MTSVMLTNRAASASSSDAQSVSPHGASAHRGIGHRRPQEVFPRGAAASHPSGPESGGDNNNTPAGGLNQAETTHRLVSNGDGSFQVAAGEVELKLRIGPRFAQYFTFVVIDLAKYDYILGLPDILAYKLELQCAPVRVVAKVGGRAVELPLLFEEAAKPLSEVAGESATGWNMSLLTPTEFKQLAGSDPIFRAQFSRPSQLLPQVHSPFCRDRRPCWTKRS